MKKYLFLYAAVVTAVCVWAFRHYYAENQRLRQSITALSSSEMHYRTRAGEEAASVQVLRLRLSEFEQLHRTDAERIRQLGIRLRRVEARATTAVETRVDQLVPLYDTVVVRPRDTALLVRDTALLRDTLRTFRWNDPWVELAGVIRRDSVACRIRSVDTLRQVVHRIPHRFLFFRWGTKSLRQEITSANPHTRIVYAEYIKIER